MDMSWCTTFLEHGVDKYHRVWCVCVCAIQSVPAAVRHASVVILCDGNGPRQSSAALARLDARGRHGQCNAVCLNSRQYSEINHSQTRTKKGKICSSLVYHDYHHGRRSEV